MPERTPEGTAPGGGGAVSRGIPAWGQRALSPSWGLCSPARPLEPRELTEAPLGRDGWETDATGLFPCQSEPTPRPRCGTHGNLPQLGSRPLRSKPASLPSSLDGEAERVMISPLSSSVLGGDSCAWDTSHKPETLEAVFSVALICGGPGWSPSPTPRLALLVKEGMVSGSCVPAVSQTMPGECVWVRSGGGCPEHAGSRGQAGEMPIALCTHGGGCVPRRSCPELACYSCRGHVDPLASL